MTRYDDRSTFYSTPFFLIIASLPIITSVIKYLAWDTYGAFDFHTFHLAGALSNSGQIDTLYDSEEFISQYKIMYGISRKLAWFYPPIILPFCQILALLPVATSYIVYCFVSILSYHLTIFYAFRRHYREIIILSVAPLSLSLGFGHPTVFLLIFMILAYKISKYSTIWTLVLLSLAAVKPHVGGVVLFLYFLKNFPRTLLPSLVTGAVFILLSSVVYGMDIWSHYITKTIAAFDYLNNALFNRVWLSSMHGSIQALSRSDGLAWTLHILTLLAFGIFGAYAFKDNREDRFWVVAGIAAFLTSPYIVVYDFSFLLFPLILILVNTDPRLRVRWNYTVLLVEAFYLLPAYGVSSINLNFPIAALFICIMLFGKMKYGVSQKLA